MICPNCKTEIVEDESRICYEHDKEYCVWCAADNMGNCSYTGCHTDINDGIPFWGDKNEVFSIRINFS